MYKAPDKKNGLLTLLSAGQVARHQVFIDELRQLNDALMDLQREPSGEAP